MLTPQPLLTTVQGLEAQSGSGLQNQVSAASLERLWCDFFDPRKIKLSKMPMIMLHYYFSMNQSDLA